MRFQVLSTPFRRWGIIGVQRGLMAWPALGSRHPWIDHHLNWKTS